MTSTKVLIDVADAWEAEAVKTDFVDAVKYVGTRPNLQLNESTQRQLFGLHTRATRGAAPEKVPADMHEEQWKAWSEVGEVSTLAAMQQYIDVVTEHVPAFLTRDDGEDDEGGAPASELPSGIMDQLAAMGIKQKQENQAGSAGAADVFEAARTGSGLGSFLPAQRDLLDADGLTPLIHAVDAEQAAAVEQLLQAEASPDCTDPQGQAPLHYAALLGNEDITQTLLSARADPCLKDEDGKTPADIARDEGHADLARLLLAAQSAP